MKQPAKNKKLTIGGVRKTIKQWEAMDQEEFNNLVNKKSDEEIDKFYEKYKKMLDESQQQIKINDDDNDTDLL